MIRRILLAVALAGIVLMPARSQNSRFDVGVKGGIGRYSYVESERQRRGVIGVEVCAWCSGRYALFGEYSHWTEPTGPDTFYRSADTVGGGIRIQGRGDVRPFLDLGVVAGKTRFSSASRTTTAGPVFGFGVLIPVGRHLYVRPQVRLYGMLQPNVADSSHAYTVRSAEMGIGWRF